MWIFKAGSSPFQRISNYFWASSESSRLFDCWLLKNTEENNLNCLFLCTGLDAPVKRMKKISHGKRKLEDIFENRSASGLRETARLMNCTPRK
jgi:hypothetical protein